MSSLVISKGYNGAGVSQSAVPSSCTPNTFAKPVSATSRIISVSATAPTCNIGSQFTIQVPTGSGAGFLKGGSCYIKATVNVTQAANDWRFSGSNMSAGSLFRQLTVSLGSQQIEFIDNYNKIYDSMLSHATNSSYVTNDCAISELAAVVTAYNATAPTVCLPLMSGLLSGQKNVPLFLLKSPLNIVVQTNSLVEAIYANTTAVTAISLTNIELCYEQVQVDKNYEDSVYQMLASGKVYEMAFKTFLSGTQSTTTSLNFQLGANLASVNAVFYTEQLAAQIADTLVQKKLCSDGITNVRLQLNGQQVIQYNVSNTPQLFLEMQRSLGCMTDATITSVGNTAAAYLSDRFLAGQCCKKFDDADLIFCGTPTQNIQLQVDHSAVNAGTVSYVFVLHDEILTIDATGQIMVHK